MALKVNAITQEIDPVPITDSGIHFIGPLTFLRRYSKTLQTLEYDKTNQDILDGRTSDGLPLVLGVSFQYRLLPDKIYDLYTTFGDSYKRIYMLSGTHLITEMATRYTAYQFFNEKQTIANDMQIKLDEFFSKHLFATVETLQITEDDLPKAFHDSILRSATTKMNITKTQKVVDSEKITFQTNLIVAKNKAEQIISRSKGVQAQVFQNAEASAAISKSYINAERIGYQIIKNEMNLTSDQLLDYIYYDSLSGGGINGGGSFASELFVGINPAAYISTGTW